MNSERRSPIASPRTRSARPYIGEVSTRRPPPFRSSLRTERARGTLEGPTSNTFHVPRPTIGTSGPFPPSFRTSTGSFPFELVANASQPLQTDEVLRPPGSSLHPDEVLDGGHPNGEPVDIFIGGIRIEVVEARGPRRGAHAVERPGRRAEGEGISALQGLRVELERHLCRRAAKRRLELLQRCRQSFQISIVSRVANIGVTGDDGRSSQRRRVAPDEDEPDLVSGQGSKDRERIEADLIRHGLAARSFGMLPSGSTPEPPAGLPGPESVGVV